MNRMHRRIAVGIIVAGASITMGSGTSGAGEPKLAKATLAGGCFWCTEAVYAEIKGVTSVTSGYIGGAVPNPTYKDVCTGQTGHA
jgi:peptide-methionine (S)-S-oxide reductase